MDPSMREVIVSQRDYLRVLALGNGQLSSCLALSLFLTHTHTYEELRGKVEGDGESGVPAEPMFSIPIRTETLRLSVSLSLCLSACLKLSQSFIQHMFK